MHTELVSKLRFYPYLHKIFPTCYDVYKHIIKVLKEFLIHSHDLSIKSTIYWDNPQIKPPLVGEHAFPLKGFVCMATHVTFGGSGGIMTTARPELP